MTLTFPTESPGTHLSALAGSGRLALLGVGEVEGGVVDKPVRSVEGKLGAPHAIIIVGGEVDPEAEFGAVRVRYRRHVAPQIVLRPAVAATVARTDAEHVTLAGRK